MGIWKKTKDYFKKQREIYRSVGEKDVINLALQNGNKITGAALSAHTQLSVIQANRKLMALHSKGVFVTKNKWENGQHSTIFKLKNPELFKDLPQNPISRAIPNPSTKQLTDAEVIGAAVKAKGRLIPGVLCMNTEVSIDYAKSRLQELQHKGVFDIEVMESGAMVYLLNDYETYADMLGTSSDAEEL